MTNADARTRVMELIVKLHLDGRQPWPPRARVVEITGVPLPMLDAVMDELQAADLITVWASTTSTYGNLGPENNGRVQRRVRPSEEMLRSK